jgi:hypothetical protein
MQRSTIIDDISRAKMQLGRDILGTTCGVIGKLVDEVGRRQHPPSLPSES